jgi:hypothetical protein
MPAARWIEARQVQHRGLIGGSLTMACRLGAQVGADYDLSHPHTGLGCVFRVKAIEYHASMSRHHIPAPALTSTTVKIRSCGTGGVDLEKETKEVEDSSSTKAARKR